MDSKDKIRDWNAVWLGVIAHDVIRKARALRGRDDPAAEKELARLARVLGRQAKSTADAAHAATQFDLVGTRGT